MSKSSLVLVAGILFLTACSEPALGPTGPQSDPGQRQLTPRDPCTTSGSPVQPPAGQPAAFRLAAAKQCRPIE